MACLYRGFESRPLRSLASESEKTQRETNIASTASGFEPQRGLGKEFPQVVGVTGASIVSDARGAEPLWKFALANLGSRAKPGIPPSPIYFKKRIS